MKITSVLKIFKIFRTYETGKMVYDKILKPVYLDLRKDAYENENTEVVKTKSNTKRKTVKKNVVDQKSKRSHQRKPNT